MSDTEIGRIYEVARSLIPAATALAKRVGVAPHAAEDLLMEAAMQVIDFRRRQGGESRIEHLPSYILTTYKHLLWPQSRKVNKEEELTDEALEQLPYLRTDAARKMEHLILIAELVKRMDVETSFIFERRLFGYSYEEIADAYREVFGHPMKANMLRKMYSTNVNKLTKELTGK